MFQWQKSPVVGGTAIALLLAGSMAMAKPVTNATTGQLLTRGPLTQLAMVQTKTQSAASWQQYVNCEQVLLHQAKQKVTSSPAQKVVVAKAAPKAAPSAEVVAVQRKAAKLKASGTIQVASRSNRSSQGLIGFAMSLIGIPYQFGGNTTKGFDCSAFTKYVFSHFGVNLPRTSFAQYDSGSRVSKGELQPGDLVFFTTYQRGPSHVGIYVGGGSFVHASNSGVRVTSMGGYYASRFVGARRVR